MPLDLIRAIKELQLFEFENYFINDGSYAIEENEDFYLLIRDQDPESKFYFGINQVIVQGTDVTYNIVYAPQGVSKTDSISFPIKSSRLDEPLEKWIKLIEEYNIHIPRYSHQNNAEVKQEFADFTFVEDGSDTYSTVPVLLLIDTYLKDKVTQLELYREENELTQEQLEVVDELIEDANELRSTQTQNTQTQTLSALSKLRKKATAAGIDIFNKVRKEIFDEAIKYISKQILDAATNPEAIYNAIKGLLE